MAQINMGRLILGGLLAGLVINIGEPLLYFMVVAGPMEELGTRLGLEDPVGLDIAVYVFFGFLMGLVAVWIYAGIRPRFGPGPKTALMAGAAVWILARAWPTTDVGIYLSIPTSTVLVIYAWTLAEILLAAWLGAWLYQEAEAGASA